ncbi:MAG: AAA family ATPase [Methylobacter sp.]|nr:AAA family ATPase [Methylobacter sp.]
MAKIEGIRVRNFRGLKDVTLGRLWNKPESEPLTAMTVIIGKNSVGKSSLFDAFGFLSDALKFGVEEACDLRGRGGFEKIRSQGQTGAIELDISYRANDDTHLIGYHIGISLDKAGRPLVEGEALFRESNNSPIFYLMLTLGVGLTLNEEKIIQDGFDFVSINKISELIYQEINKNSDEQDIARMLSEAKAALKGQAEVVEFSDKRKLGISTLGALKQHPIISEFRQFVESWYLSYFTPDAARSLPMTGAQQHLNSKGNNLANVVQFMEREHKDRFQSILNRIAEKIPGIDKIDTEKTSDGRLLLRFNDKGFQDPFYAPQMSDGTLKVFAYLLLLEDPTPPPFICIEEPENGLYHKLLETLAAEFRAHATGREGGTQLFITTHQPYFVDALDPDEVWVLEKGEDGFSTVTRASDIPYVQNMVNEGQPLGALWYSDYLDAR